MTWMGSSDIRVHSPAFWSYSTVPTFDSCTECLGSPCLIHDRTPDCHPVTWAWYMDDLTTERSFALQPTRIIDVLGLFLDNGCLYNQAHVDIRSIGTGIKCLNCILMWMRRRKHVFARFLNPHVECLRQVRCDRAFCVSVSILHCCDVSIDSKTP